MPVPGERRAGFLGRLAGDACHLQHARQTIIAPQHGIVRVEVPAPAQQHLPAAVDDLAIREIGALFPFHQRLGFVPVQRQGYAILLREFHQEGQQPGIAPGSQDHIWVIAAQIGPQAHRNGTRLIKGQGITDPCP